MIHELEQVSGMAGKGVIFLAFQIDGRVNKLQYSYNTREQ